MPSSPENKRHKKHARNIAHDKAELQDAGKKASPAAPPPPTSPPSPTSWPPQLRVLPPRQKGSSHGTVHRENDAAASVSPERGHCGKCQKSPQHGEREMESKFPMAVGARANESVGSQSICKMLQENFPLSKA